VVLVIRDPDYENAFVVDGIVETIDLDLAGRLMGRKDSEPCATGSSAIGSRPPLRRLRTFPVTAKSAGR
jgi:hypothetical protein